MMSDNLDIDWFGLRRTEREKWRTVTLVSYNRKCDVEVFMGPPGTCAGSDPLYITSGCIITADLFNIMCRVIVVFRQCWYKMTCVSEHVCSPGQRVTHEQISNANVSSHGNRQESLLEFKGASSQHHFYIVRCNKNVKLILNETCLSPVTLRLVPGVGMTVIFW